MPSLSIQHVSSDVDVYTTASSTVTQVFSRNHINSSIKKRRLKISHAVYHWLNMSAVYAFANAAVAAICPDSFVKNTAVMTLAHVAVLVMLTRVPLFLS